MYSRVSLLLSTVSFLYPSFFFNDTATTEIYTLSLHDALPISSAPTSWCPSSSPRSAWRAASRDRKSTRLNSSYITISYAVFCLKKKKKDRNMKKHKKQEVFRTCKH